MTFEGDLIKPLKNFHLKKKSRQKSILANENVRNELRPSSNNTMDAAISEMLRSDRLILQLIYIL